MLKAQMRQRPRWQRFPATDEYKSRSKSPSTVTDLHTFTTANSGVTCGTLHVHRSLRDTHEGTLDDREGGEEFKEGTLDDREGGEKFKEETLDDRRR